MPRLTFHDVLVETSDPEASARFWAPVLDLRIEEREGDGVWLRGDVTEDVFMTARGSGSMAGLRLHFDATDEQVERFVQHGARRVEGGEDAWTILEGPDGLRMWVFRVDVPPDPRNVELVFFSPDPWRSARWWATQLGGKAEVTADRRHAWVHPFPNAPVDQLSFTAPPDAERGPEGNTVGPGGATGTDGRLVLMRYAASDLDALLIAGARMVGSGGPGSYRLTDPYGVPFEVVTTR